MAGRQGRGFVRTAQEERFCENFSGGEVLLVLLRRRGFLSAAQEERFREYCSGGEVL